MIEREIKQSLKDFPKAEISVVLATDGDHTYGKNQPDNLKVRIQESQNICALAEEVAKELQVETLQSNAIMYALNRKFGFHVIGNDCTSPLGIKLLYSKHLISIYTP